MSSALPEITWIAVPNIGSIATSLVGDWGLDALILTGGDDIGKTPLRDETERILLHHFVDMGKPVFGVCRGMQLIQSEYGGNLSFCSRDGHVAVRHEVEFLDGSPWPTPTPYRVSVNSFHTRAILPDELADGLVPLALTMDGYVEAFYASEAPLATVMWHPEREVSPQAHDRLILRHLFGLTEGTEY